MQDAPTGCHPLGVPLGDDATAAVGIVVGDLTVEDVADGLDAAVGVPRCSLGLAGAVHLRPDVIEQQEGVGLGEREVTGEGPGDDEPGPLGFAAGGDDLGHRTRPGDRIGSGDARQDECVFDGDGRHGYRLLSSSSSRTRGMTCVP